MPSTSELGAREGTGSGLAACLLVTLATRTGGNDTTARPTPRGQRHYLAIGAANHGLLRFVAN